MRLALPWQCLGDLSLLGYVYDKDRSVMRVQQMGPRYFITCFRHGACRLFLKEQPKQADLYKWLYCVEAAGVDMSAAERKALRDRHVKEGNRLFK